jgi:DNA-binding LacI/PurR family transcriptional regulator
MGFDDTLHAQLSDPPLTTLKVDRVLMGALGVQMLVGRAERPDRATVTGAINVSLIIRESVGPPRAPKQ